MLQWWWSEVRPSLHANFYFLSKLGLSVNLRLCITFFIYIWLKSNCTWQVKSCTIIRTCRVTHKLRIFTLSTNAKPSESLNTYLPPDTLATALWRSDHTPPQKPSLSDVKDKLQHPAARCPGPSTGRHPSSTFTPDPPCVLHENFQLRPPFV